MNLLTIKTINDTDLELKIPANAREISFGQLIKLTDPNISNLEALSILAGVTIDDLYNAKSITEVTEEGKIYLDMLLYNIKIIDLDKVPKKIMLNYAGKYKKIKIKKYIAMEPAGAYIYASKVIFNEMKSAMDKYGDDKWEQNFEPSLTSMAAVVDSFLYWNVTGKLWKNHDRESIAEKMNAADVIILAKHFFNAYPNLSSYKPDGKLNLVVNAVLRRFKAINN